MIDLYKDPSKRSIHFQSAFNNISSSYIKSNSSNSNNKSNSNHSKIKRLKTSQSESKYSMNPSHISKK